ncbi:MAG: preprotein translocase subunit YajC [Firmicutes bacterium]|nr:preprotein translocase subunit YajC [Bacillota bacterium]
MGGVIIYVVIFIALIYFVMIRPQKKRQKEHDNLVNTLSLGVEIVTIGGIHGEVSRIKDDTLWIKVSNNVEIEIEKSAVGRTIS